MPLAAGNYLALDLVRAHLPELPGCGQFVGDAGCRSLASTPDTGTKPQPGHRFMLKIARPPIRSSKIVIDLNISAM